MWHELLGHDRIVERFRRITTRGRMASTYLLTGPPGIGKRLFAQQLAKALLCSEHEDSQLEFCGTCESCRLCQAESHPDLEQIGCPEDRQHLTLEQFIGDRDHRNQVGLCHRMALRPTMGGRRIAIIDDADLLTIECANALLKTLEEPPAGALFLLLGTSPAKQLPTIRSRSQVVRFAPLEPEVVQQVLHKLGEPVDERLAATSVADARELAVGELQSFRQQLHQRLGGSVHLLLALSKLVQDFVAEAGTEAKLRRARLRRVILFAIEFYRENLRKLCELSAQQEPSWQHAAALDAGCTQIERCLRALEQIDRNANLATLIDCWLDDLARLQVRK